MPSQYLCNIRKSAILILSKRQSSFSHKKFKVGMPAIPDPTNEDGEKFFFKQMGTPTPAPNSFS